jgi:hypothetical protein
MEDMNIVIFAFRQCQQQVIDKWLPFIEDLLRNYPSLAYYELPTIGKLARAFIVLEWLVHAGMRSGIQNHEVRERTKTLYIRKGKFKKQLEIGDEGNIHLFLINKQVK